MTLRLGIPCELRGARASRVSRRTRVGHRREGANQASLWRELVAVEVRINNDPARRKRASAMAVTDGVMDAVTLYSSILGTLGTPTARASEHGDRTSRFEGVRNAANVLSRVPELGRGTSALCRKCRDLARVRNQRRHVAAATQAPGGQPMTATHVFATSHSSTTGAGLPRLTACHCSFIFLGLLRKHAPLYHHGNARPTGAAPTVTIVSQTRCVVFEL